MNPGDIGPSVLFATTVLIILATLWPFLPSSGAFAQLSRRITGASNFVIPALVIGAPAVAYYLLRGQ
jgi:ABC-type dipeptide/oligopeptide/nickel transport system permease component